MNNAVILTNGLFTSSDAKTAHGLIRGTERYTVIGLIDSTETAGNDAGVLLDGQHRNIPILAKLNDAIIQFNKIDYLIIGIATVGGRLPADMLIIIEEAINAGISIVNGLHEFLQDKPALVLLANEKNVQLIDVRKPKSREELHFWTGDIFNVKAPIIGVIGMDCAMGKRTAARMLTQACKKHDINAQMIYTGQTGWLQGGTYGFIFDSTLNDFVSGELEYAITSCWKNTHADVIFIEGQSSLRNPSGPCGMELMISGNAKHVVLLFAPKRKYFDNEEHWGSIPTVESEIELIEKIGSKVIAVAIHTENCSPEEAYAFQKEYEHKLNIPVLLPVEEGVEQLIPFLKSLI